MDNFLFLILNPVLFLLQFFFLRIDIKIFQVGIKYKKVRRLSKGQTFWEWLFLTRIKDKIPLFYKIFYYGIFVLYTVAFLATLTMDLCGIDEFKYIRIPLAVCFGLYILYMCAGYFRIGKRER